MASNITPPDGTSDGQVNDAILREVSREIVTQWQELGRLLQIPQWQLDAIHLQYQANSPVEESYRMLEKWRQANSTNATVCILAERLKELRRGDIAHKILKMPPESSHGNSYPNQSQERSEAEWLKRLRNKLCAKYETFVMKGLPWMGNMRISLADYYVDLSVETDDSDNTRMPSNRRKGRSTIREEEKLKDANEVFRSAFSSDKRPLRVLVEGPPGYGKTTLSAKLCFDYAASADYMKNFDVVLHFPLRTFEGSLEEMLCRAADLADSHDRDRFLGILNNPTPRILLVLDGFDEVAQQRVKAIFALLQGQRFPHVAVVVTSRPGQFTFERWEKENNGCAELTRDWNRLWQSRITIFGINKEMKALFIQKHLAGVPEHIRGEVSSQLTQLEKRKIIEPEFLKCPLFLLMLFLLATDKETGGIHNLRTPTDLYKNVFNFIIRRYCSKQNEPVNEKVDLFTFIEAPKKPFYVDLLCQFGEFALRALTEKKLSFSQEEVLGSSQQRNPRILELGLLTQSVSMVGIWEEVVYEPVHKSLLEFSAAYALWLQCPESDRGSWEEKVVGLWRCERYRRPLWFIMFEGLMRDRFAALLDALSPYASCGMWEQWLRRSVSEIELTESVLSSLTPFLPTHWKQKNERYFSMTQHDALLLHGIRQGTIKRVGLTGFLATPMPDNVVVDTAMFRDIEDTVGNVHGLNCRRLVFLYSDVSRGLARIPSTINFQTLSLQLQGDATSELRLLRSAFMAGALKDIQIQISCRIEKTAAVVALTDLIKLERLKALSLKVEPYGSSLESYSLSRAAANSSQLTTLLLDGWFSHACVDLCHLCGGVQKKWQFLSITDCDVAFRPQTDQTFQVNCLVLDCPIRPAVLRFLEVCQVTSLQCKPPLLAAIATLPLLPQHLTELNVLLDRTTEQCRLPHLPNLTVLIFTIWGVPGSFTVRDFLFGSRSFLRFKGIEIWGAQHNKKLSVEFVKCVSDCLEQSMPVPTCQGMPRSSHSLQLQYFLLQSDETYQKKNFLAPLGDMAAHLINKSLSRLDIVAPWSPDLIDLFSPVQGFRWETDLWGSRSEDTILCRMKYDTKHDSFYNCYSIRHTDN